jgi:hypothetical protein
MWKQRQHNCVNYPNFMTLKLSLDFDFLFASSLLSSSFNLYDCQILISKNAFGKIQDRMHKGKESNICLLILFL